MENIMKLFGAASVLAQAIAPASKRMRTLILVARVLILCHPDF